MKCSHDVFFCIVQNPILSHSAKCWRTHQCEQYHRNRCQPQFTLNVNAKCERFFTSSQFIVIFKFISLFLSWMSSRMSDFRGHRLLWSFFTPQRERESLTMLISIYKMINRCSSFNFHKKDIGMCSDIFFERLHLMWVKSELSKQLSFKRRTHWHANNLSPPSASVLVVLYHIRSFCSNH